MEPIVEKGGTHCRPPKTVNGRLPRSRRVSRDLARAQVTPESGPGGRMGGRLNNWIDNRTWNFGTLELWNMELWNMELWNLELWNLELWNMDLEHVTL